MGQQISKWVGKPEIHILMLGLPDSGRTTILYRLQMDVVIETVPTTAFNLESFEYDNVKFTIWDPCMELPWRHYHNLIKVLIWVIDGSASEESWALSKRELLRLLSDSQLKHIPVLIYINKLERKAALSSSGPKDLPLDLPLPSPSPSPSSSSSSILLSSTEPSLTESLPLYSSEPSSSSSSSSSVVAASSLLSESLKQQSASLSSSSNAESPGSTPTPRKNTDGQPPQLTTSLSTSAIPVPLNRSAQGLNTSTTTTTTPIAIQQSQSSAQISRHNVPGASPSSPTPQFSPATVPRSGTQPSPFEQWIDVQRAEQIRQFFLRDNLSVFKERSGIVYFQPCTAIAEKIEHSLLLRGLQWILKTQIS